jgi:hypothetical protein
MVRCLIALIVSFTCLVHADVLFEGYFKVTSGGVHIGYQIARYEFDTKTKRFMATTFLKTNELGGNLTESVKAISTDDMKPISFSYTMLQGTQTKVIDGKVEKNKIVAQVKEGGQSKKVVNDLPKGTFFSSILTYVILKSPQGLKADSKYDYTAINEEDAGVVKAVAIAKNLESIDGIKAYKILNDFKNSKFISYVTEKGEVLSTKSPVQGIGAELVPQPSLATANFPVPTALLRTLFGEVPTGVKNEVSRRAQDKPKTVDAKTETKTESKNESKAETK